MKAIFMAFGMLTCCYLPAQHPVYEQYLKARNQYAAISYKINLSHLAFGDTVPARYEEMVFLKRDTTDSLFSGKVLIQSDSIWLGYDGQRIFRANPQRSELIIADASLNPGIYIKSTGYGNLLDDFFLNDRDFISYLLESEKYKSTVRDTMLDGRSSWYISSRLPDEGEFINQRFGVAIDMENHHLAWKRYEVEFQENWQITDWKYSEVRYLNDYTFSLFDSSNLLTFQHVQDLGIPESREPDSLQTKIHELTGSLIGSSDSLSLSGIKSEYILLDFWYSSCYPCIKSIPIVNEINLKLKDRDVFVLGINPIDNEIRDRARIERFLRNNPMTYPTILLDKAKSDTLNIPGYPTLLLLNGTRQIIYSHTGFNPALLEEIVKAIEGNN